jgi:hypothetical protein
MTAQTVTLHPDIRMHLLIDLMATKVIDCNLGELHKIIDETENLVGKVTINVDAINAELVQLRK